jgi:multidrug efflux pump subunit AcrB
MSLGGLAIAIGLVVDDAIVVTEGIVRRLEEGHPPHEAVDLGTRDMLGPVIGTTLTTVVVFAPLALLTGVTGRFLGAFAVTLAIAVLLSLAMALTLIPIMARLLKPRRKRESKGDDRIGRAIRWLVHRRFVPIAVVVALIAVGVVAEQRVSTGFLPAMDEGAFVLDFFLPSGTSLEETDRIAQAIDEVLANTPEVATFTRRTGTELGPATATVQNRGDIMVKLVARSDRDSITEVIDHIRDKLHGAVPEARLEYVQVLQDVLADLAGNPEPIEIRVLGDDPRALEAWAEETGEKLAKRTDELVDVFDGRNGMTPILRTTVDAQQLERLKLDAAGVGSDLQIALAGKDVGQILRPERVIDVRLRYPDDIRFSAEALQRSLIAYGPRALPLGDVVRVDRVLAPAALRRDGLRSVLVMTAGTPHGDLGAAENAVRDVLREFPPPRGTLIEIGGQAASGAQSRHELLVVAGVAILLVLIVLILQLHSLRLALVVLLGAPLSTVGGLLILALTDTPLDVSSITGLILLVGLVVKNGILLLEHAQRGLSDGLDLETAIVAAARRRLRPILMTTAATLAGLAPLALGIGSGAELQRPLAIAVIGGLALATLVTLVVTPGLTALVSGRRKTA